MPLLTSNVRLAFMENSKTGTLLLIMGWGLFITCLLLPALVYNQHSIFKGPILGWSAGFAAIDTIFNFQPRISWLQWSTCGIGNIFAILAIFSIYVNNKKTLLYFSVIFLVFFIAALSFYFKFKHTTLGSGYYIWVLSFLAISSSYFIAYKETSLTNQSSSPTKKPVGWDSA